MSVVTKNGCPSSIYVEIQLLDKSGSAVGYSNDTVGSLAPEQVAKLDFTVTEEDDVEARLTEINCY